MGIANLYTDDHAERVASIVIGTDTTDPDDGGPMVAPTGVALGADLYSSATDPGPPPAPYDVEAAITINHIATLSGVDVRAINTSFGNPFDATHSLNDGNQHLTQFVDWSASADDVLYVASGYEGNVNPVPKDNFNGITVAYSTLEGGVYRRVATGNDPSFDAEGDRTSIGLLAPGENVDVTALNAVETRSGTSYAAPHVTATAALLYQYANERISSGALGWDAVRSRRHETMKAVLLNSADKFIDNETVTVPGQGISLSGFPMFGADTQGGKLAVSGQNLVISGVSQNLAAHLYQPDATGEWAIATTFARNPWGVALPIAQSVDIDGEVIVVGSQYDNPKGLVSGSVYVVERSAGSWNQSPKLTALDTDAGDLLGRAVDVRGSQMVISAPGVGGIVGAYGGVINGIGAAYLFNREPNGQWTQVAKLSAKDPLPGNEFGSAVAISASSVLVGMKLDDAPANNIGALYVFKKDGTGIWNEVAKIHASDSSADAFFGSTLSVSGSHLIVGAPGAVNDRWTSSSGAAYVFEDDGFGNWTQIEKLVPDGPLVEGFGSSISLDGSMAVIGAYRGDSRIGTATNAVYVFERDVAGQWNQLAKLESKKPAGEEAFGMGIATNGSSVFVAAQKLLGNGYVSGKVYVFAIPEPETMILASIYAIGVSLTGWSRRRKSSMRGTT